MAVPQYVFCGLTLEMAACPAQGWLCMCPRADQASLSSPSRWAFLELRTNGRYNDSLQAYAAGVVEASVSEEVRARRGNPGLPPPTPPSVRPRELGSI